MSIQDNAAPIADKGRLRKIIRKKIVEILKNNTDAGVRVFPNATVPPWEQELPVILVYQRNEPVSPYADAPRELLRSLDIAIEIVAKGPEENEDLATPEVGVKSLEDILDDISEQVETLMHADDSLQSTCDDSILTGTEFEFESTGALPIGSARLNYEVSYTTMAPRAANIPDDFKTNNIDYNIGDDENTREAKDTVDLPTT